MGNHPSMDLKDVLSINLRRFRTAQRLTQEELAHRVGISARYLGAIERANVSPTVSVLGRLAAGLDVDPCLLIAIPDEASIPPR